MLIIYLHDHPYWQHATTRIHHTATRQNHVSRQAKSGVSVFLAQHQPSKAKKQPQRNKKQPIIYLQSIIDIAVQLSSVDDK